MVTREGPETESQESASIIHKRNAKETLNANEQKEPQKDVDQKWHYDAIGKKRGPVDTTHGDAA